jgi:hypothetical protein
VKAYWRSTALLIFNLANKWKTVFSIQLYISNKMHKSQSGFNLATVLHVSGVTITHLQEHKTIVTTASGNRYTVLLSAAIVENLELIAAENITV